MSSLVRWLAKLKGERPAPKTDGLPNPNGKRERRAKQLCPAANAEIELSMADGQSTSNSRKRASTVHT